VNGIRSSPAARDRLQAQRRVLGRRALVGDQVAAQRLEHQPLRGGHLAQPRELLARERAEVGVRQQAALRAPRGSTRRRSRRSPRSRAPPGARAPRGDGPGSSPVRISSSLTLRRAAWSSSAAHLVGLVQVGLVGREGAVLAVRDARARQRQRQVAREGDPPARDCVHGAHVTAKHRDRRPAPARSVVRGERAVAPAEEHQRVGLPLALSRADRPRRRRSGDRPPRARRRSCTRSRRRRHRAPARTARECQATPAKRSTPTPRSAWRSPRGGRRTRSRRSARSRGSSASWSSSSPGRTGSAAARARPT
jgi:hypothetical protein